MTAFLDYLNTVLDPAMITSAVIGFAWIGALGALIASFLL